MYHHIQIDRCVKWQNVLKPPANPILQKGTTSSIWCVSVDHMSEMCVEPNIYVCGPEPRRTTALDFKRNRFQVLQKILNLTLSHICICPKLRTIRKEFAFELCVKCRLFPCHSSLYSPGGFVSISAIVYAKTSIYSLPEYYVCAERKRGTGVSHICMVSVQTICVDLGSVHQLNDQFNRMAL